MSTPAQTLDNLVRVFISKRRPARPWWTGPTRPRDLAEAIDASLGLRDGDKIHDHQYRVGRKALSAAQSRLRRVKAEISTTRDFDKLHLIVERETHDVPRFGELATYDVAQRIGAFLKLAPEQVYLHAGTRDGAKAFGVTGDRVAKSAFPKPLQELSAQEIEDFLCIFADQLRGRSSVSSHAWCRSSQSASAPGDAREGCPPKRRRAAGVC